MPANRPALFVLLLSGLTLSACGAPPKAGTTNAHRAAADAAESRVGPDWPARTDERATTSGEIYLANLSGQIATLQKRQALQPRDAELARLALLHYHRFQVVGRLSDAESARRLLESAQSRPHEAGVDLALAQILIGFHEYNRAGAVLDHARDLGAPGEELQGLRERIAIASGQARLDAALPAAETDPIVLVEAAAGHLERGDLALATSLLRQAQENYADTSPFVLSWIQLQQGIAFLRHGDHAKARIFFAAALERLPQYSVAAEHLAETELALGEFATARERYRQVYAQTGHPEFLFRQSVAERELGLAGDAARHEALAVEGYEELLARWPLMYADHAARFFLERGDTGRAHALAAQNLKTRQDIRARTLAIVTGLALDDPAPACSLLRKIRGEGFAPPELEPTALPNAIRCDA